MNSGRGRATFLLFGLSEIGNITFHLPNNPNLEGAVGNHNVTYVVIFPLPFCLCTSPLLNFQAVSRVLSRSSLLRAALDGSLTGDDTLGTVLCETLLSFLLSG